MTLTLLSLLAAGGLLMAWTELLSARAFRHSGRAHGLAEAGLATAIARARGPSPSIGPIGFGPDTVRVSFTQIGLLSKSERLFEVRSEATVAVGADRFVRTVAEVLWIADPLSVPAAPFRRRETWRGRRLPGACRASAPRRPAFRPTPRRSPESPPARRIR